MAFRSGFSMFDDDPFFSGHPSMGFGFQPHPMLDGPRDPHRMQLQRRDPFDSMWPFGGGSPFARMDSMFQDMQQMMQVAENDPNTHSFSSSSVMQYSSSGGQGGQPRVYHATSSTRQAPGGVRETRKTVRDSETGTQKMSIGHHIKDRSHTIEKGYNTKTKEREEHEEFVNMDEDDAGHFNEEWQHQMQRHAHSQFHPSLNPTRRQTEPRALPPSRLNTHSTHTHPYGDPHMKRQQRQQQRSHRAENHHRQFEPLGDEGTGTSASGLPPIVHGHRSGLDGGLEKSRDYRDRSNEPQQDTLGGQGESKMRKKKKKVRIESGPH